MSDIVLFTGAGASVPFGYPTTVQFMQDIAKPHITDPHDVFQDLNNLLQNQKGSNNPVDIEEVLWQLDDFYTYLKKQFDSSNFINHFFLDPEKFYYLGKEARDTVPWKNTAHIVLADVEKLIIHLDCEV